MGYFYEKFQKLTVWRLDTDNTRHSTNEIARTTKLNIFYIPKEPKPVAALSSI